jgi:hypothetical protein
MTTNARLFAVILALQSLTLLSMWTGNGPLPAARAQIPDAGGQRQQVIEELKSMNGKMDKLIEVLESGKMQVNAILPEEKDQQKAKGR